MQLWKRAVLGAVIVLACAGVYTAVMNMPVLSGCTFYGECPDDASTSESSAVASADETVHP